MTEQSAVASFRGLPVDNTESLVDIRIPVPEPGPRDVIVEVAAVSVNPADVKVRAGLSPSKSGRILGFDGAGTVTAVGSEVTTLAVGDEVWWAGSINRPGSNQRFQAVDERIVGRRPTTIDAATAAALPLTAITAWEVLFDRLRLDRDSAGSLLVVGGAGGTGSMIAQLASTLTGVRVISTAGRPESADWVRKMGAHEVIGRGDLAKEVLAVAPEGVDYAFSAFSSGNVRAFADAVKPFGHIVAIDDPARLDLMPLKRKSIAWHWELMFTRPLFETPDMIEQKNLLETVARLVDDGTLRSTATTTLEGITAESMREAHRLVESGATIGKVVLAAS